MKDFDNKNGINALSDDELDAVSGGANLKLSLGKLKSLKAAKSVMPILVSPIGATKAAGSSENVQYMDIVCGGCGKILHINVMEPEAICDDPLCKYVNKLSG